MARSRGNEGPAQGVESFAATDGYAAAPPQQVTVPSFVPPPSQAHGPEAVAAVAAKDAEQLDAEALAMMKAMNPGLDPVTYGVLFQEQMAAARQMVRSRREQEECSRLAMMSTQERTQYEADKRWGDTTTEKYMVSIPGDKAQPELVIPARSPEEAQGRYIRLCGIRNTEHDYAIALVKPPNVGDVA